MINKIIANKQDILQGKTKVIPCSINRFSKEFAGIRRGDYICFTGNTSSGKTTLTKKLAVWDAIEYAIKHNLDLRILYFGLEESEEEFEYSLMSYLLKTRFGLRYNILDFEFITDGVKDEDLSKIEEIEHVFKQWRSYIDYYDNIYHPYSIYSKVKEFAESRGRFVITNPAHTNWDKYVPNNPDEFIIVIVDHLSLVLPEKSHGNQLDLAMQSMSSYLRQYVSKKFKYTAISVHQQMAASEDLDHVKEKAWMPSLNGLADNKRVGRDYLTVIGIGNPKRYGISSFGGYSQLGDYDGFMRFLVIRKQRYGPVDSYIGITMDGKTGTIKAAPPPTEIESLKQLKDFIKSL
jgi:energy-coupling factor transporter ATP-binding protein EcfA2